MPEVECENCGGSDFYLEAGFYYCKECQIQSQDIREHVFEDFAAAAEEGIQTKRPTTGKKLRDGSQKTEGKITSWECYNYILFALCEELIQLGAQPRLKSVVKHLWLKYLQKMEVMTMGKDTLPHLQAVNSTKDAEIVYGVRKRRRATSTKSSSDETMATLDESAVKRVRAKKKKAMIQSHYDHFNQSQGPAESLHNETLTTLGSSQRSKNTFKITYNRYSRKEMMRKQSRTHLYQHCMDMDHEMRCHNITYRKVSFKYRTGPHVLSLNKLYAILYLGLLIIQDRIQLSDIIRLIKEGNLSFNSYSHTFPEDYTDKKINFHDHKKNAVFASAPMRRITREMARFLGVDFYVPRQNLNAICDRYCEELSLPDEITMCVKKIIYLSAPKMSFGKCSKVPNYEGRVLSVILFVMKLLFGFDDVTEYKLGIYSEILSGTSNDFFNIVAWLKFLYGRRNLFDYVTSQSDVLVGLLTRKIYPEVRYNKCKDNYNTVLGRLADKVPLREAFSFPKTLYPLREFTETSRFLHKNSFTQCTIAHILQPHNFLRLVNGERKEPQWISGGANTEWLFEPIIRVHQQKNARLRDRKKKVTVKVDFRRQSLKLEHERKTQNVKLFRKEYFAANELNFNRNEKLMRNLRGLKDFDMTQIEDRTKYQKNDLYTEHYNPFQTYWLRIVLQSDCMNDEECEQFIRKFPRNFHLLFEECCKMLQQSPKEFLIELQYTELQLIYGGHFQLREVNPKRPRSQSVRQHVRRSSRLW